MIENSRCERILPNGEQCPEDACPGTDRCEKHTTQISRTRRDMRGYDVQNAQVSSRLDQFATSPEIYSLRHEIAVSRQIQERMLAALTTDDTPEALVNMTVQTPAILRVLEVQQKLVTSGAQLELKLGSLLSKETVRALASRMVEILFEEISHLEGAHLITERVTTRLSDEIDKARNKSE